MLKIITDNPLVSAIIAGLILAAVFWTIRKLKDRSDSQKIYSFLQSSSAGTEYAFRTTAAISSGTSIAESRVAELCSKDKRIKRNERERQSWRLEDRGR